MYKITISELEEIRNHLNDVRLILSDETLITDNKGESNVIKLVSNSKRLTVKKTKILNKNEMLIKNLKEKYDI